MWKVIDHCKHESSDEDIDGKMNKYETASEKLKAQELHNAGKNWLNYQVVKTFIE
jgi:hypothetical protein